MSLVSAGKQRNSCQESALARWELSASPQALLFGVAAVLLEQFGGRFLGAGALQGLGRPLLRLNLPLEKGRCWESQQDGGAAALSPSIVPPELGLPKGVVPELGIFGISRVDPFPWAGFWPSSQDGGE